MQRREGSIQLLAQRLRILREKHWADQGITQTQLAKALSAEKSVSVPLISSWESLRNPKILPASRLEEYATFFATKRSIAHEPFRVLKLTQLTPEERAYRDELLQELIELRNAAIVEIRSREQASANPAPPNLWRFPDGRPIMIVCGRLPDAVRQKMPYTDPDHPDHIETYRYSDLDALIELYAHLRVTNPTSSVSYRTAADLTNDDYSAHIVVLGGVDWNSLTRDVLQRIELPVSQIPHESQIPDEESLQISYYEVNDNTAPSIFRPRLNSSNILIEDVGHLYRGPSPYNFNSTITMCNGIFARGVVGVVRALTDQRLREKNEEYIQRRFGGQDTFSILTRVPVVNGKIVTPDWTIPQNRLHEWPQAKRRYR